MTGCDTTSALYGHGKKKTFNLLLKCPDLRKCVEIFNNHHSDPLHLLEKSSHWPYMNKHRYHCFMKAVTKCPIHTQLQLASLPSTSVAAREYSLLIYHQVLH